MLAGLLCTMRDLSLHQGYRRCDVSSLREEALQHAPHTDKLGNLIPKHIDNACTWHASSSGCCGWQ